MFTGETARETLARLARWAREGRGGGRRVTVEVCGHANDERLRAVLTLSEWSPDVERPRPNTVTKAFDPEDDDAFREAVDLLFTRWFVGDFDHATPDDDD